MSGPHTPLHRDDRRAEADVEHQRAIEHVAFGKRPQRIPNLARERAEGSKVPRQGDAHRAREDLMIGVRGKIARRDTWVEFDRVHDVATLLFECLDEQRDVLGLVLEIGVHQDQDVAARVVERGGDGRVLAEVSREADDPQSRVGRGLCLQPRQRTVATAIVHDHRLVVKPLERRSHAFDERIDGGFVVVDGYENRQVRCRR